MKGKNGVKFIAVIVFIILLTVIAVNGLQIGNSYIKGAKDINTGIDIRGGVSAILVPSFTEGQSFSDSEVLDGLRAAKEVIKKRLESKMIFDASVVLDTVNQRVVVDIPRTQGDNAQSNPQKTLDEVGQVAHLTFQEVDEDLFDGYTEYGLKNYLPTDKIIVDGKDVEDAQPAPDPEYAGRWVVTLKFNSTAKTDFAEATQRLIGKKIAIFMDDQLISAPRVNTVIPGGEGYISGQTDAAEAETLASLIRSGALPFKLEASKIDAISPTLGKGALDIAVAAGIIAFIIVCLYMLIYYRLPGLLANIALLGLVSIQLCFISWLGISITLPGIGGILLTIGMGVDANIIIFERIKEELKEGKTLRAAIDTGFKRAFTAVADANITTLIVAIILYIMGTGPIKGFGITLGLGVALSFFTAITASRIMLRAVSNVDIAKNKWLYGA